MVGVLQPCSNSWVWRTEKLKPWWESNTIVWERVLVYLLIFVMGEDFWKCQFRLLLEVEISVESWYSSVCMFVVAQWESRIGSTLNTCYWTGGAGSRDVWKIQIVPHKTFDPQLFSDFNFSCSLTTNFALAGPTLTFFFNDQKSFSHLWLHYRVWLLVFVSV